MTVGRAQAPGNVVAAPDLRAEVEHAFATPYLEPPQRQRISLGSVDPGLARGRQPEAGLRDEAAFASAEQSGWVAEGRHRMADTCF